MAKKEGGSTLTAYQVVELAELKESVTRLKKEVASQNRITQALWKMIAVKWDLNLEDLEAAVKKLKEEDAKLKTGLDSDCPACGEPVKEGRKSCFWCGASLGEGLFTRPT